MDANGTDRTREEVAALLRSLAFTITIEDQQEGQVKVIKDSRDQVIGTLNRANSSQSRISKSTIR